jgi:hypothetical protein
MCAAALKHSPQQQHQQQKCRVVDSSNSSPLDKDDILDAVFSYVGICDYIYTGAVSKRWIERYTTLCNNAPEAHRKCTALSSVVTTPARLQVAVDSNLELKKWQVYFFAEAVVMYSLEPSSISPLCDEDPANWQDLIWRYAVDHNKLQLLQCLHSRGFDSRVFIASSAHTAAENDYVELLKWLYSITDAAWAEKRMQDLFYDAGRWASLDSLEWLREKGNACKSMMFAKLRSCLLRW